MRRLAWAWGLVLGVGLLVTASSAWAVITRLMPLREVLAESDYIAVVKVERLDPDKPAVVLTVEEDLKGKVPFRRLAMNLAGDSEAKKDNHTPQLLKRLGPNLSLVVFANQRGKRYTAFFYSNGTWFQAVGQKADDTVRWSFTHCEPYLRRTFKGPTAELRTIIVDGLAGKRKPPEPNEKEPPGLGPEVKPAEKKKETGKQGDKVTRWQGDKVTPELSSSPCHLVTLSPCHANGGPLFAVIPTVLAGPLALLALLFPAVFGGLMLTMRRWFAALSVVSMNSTLFLVNELLLGSWLSPLVLWGSMTAIAFAGTLWAWHRHRQAVRGAGVVIAGRMEHLVLWGLTLTGLVLVGVTLYHQESLLADPMQRTMLVIWIGVWGGTLALAVQHLAAARFSPEGAMVAAMLCAYVSVGTLLWPRGDAATGAVRIVWEFRPKERGLFLSAPLVTPQHVYAAAAHVKGFDTRGVLYCRDRATGDKVWSFDDGGDLQQVYSTPCLADGRLYFGEGLHENHGCKLYCLNAADGTKLWEFETTSHTESSPCVADGKVFFGAGDDGVYALDAMTGKLLWNYRNDVHIDGSPLVVGNRLWVGSGESRTYRTTEVVCLDTATGKPVWRMPADLPAWGAPALRGDRLLIGLGNGRLLQSDSRKPAGALLCLDAATGKRLWRVDVGDAVHVQPMVSQGRVFFGSRDRHVYCVSLDEGKVHWKHDLGSSVVASPAWEEGRLYVAGTAGHLACLNGETGAALWTLDLGQQTQASVQVVAAPTLGKPAKLDERRRIFVSASVGSELSMLPVLYCLEDQ